MTRSFQRDLDTTSYLHARPQEKVTQPGVVADRHACSRPNVTVKIVRTRGQGGRQARRQLNVTLGERINP